MGLMVGWNNLNKIDLPGLPADHCLSELNVSRNNRPALILQEAVIESSAVPIVREEEVKDNWEFRLWRYYTAEPAIL